MSVPESPDRVLLGLGLVEGKSWPEDAVEPPPHYWRIKGAHKLETIHFANCHLARRSGRRLPWFWADGKPPWRVLRVLMANPHLFHPCRLCWHTHIKIAAEAEWNWPLLFAIENAALSWGSDSEMATT